MAQMTNSVGITVGFGTSTRVTFTEVSLTPPGVDSGGVNNVTTHANTAWQTFAPKALKTLTPLTMVVNYDSAAYGEIIAAVGANELFTVTFPDTSTLAFWGTLTSFQPGDMNAEADEDPTATVTLTPTLRNASGVETAPAYTDD
jgi:hypothetical protein